MMKFTRFSILSALAALTLQGCATGTTYSQLLGQRYYTTNIDTYPLVIASVDGKSSTTRPMYVDPGPRRIVVRGPPGGAGFSVVEAMSLDVKPCTRYYLVAVKANPLDTYFTPKVDFEQPLGSACKPPVS
jgi:hypothetical protein